MNHRNLQAVYESLFLFEKRKDKGKEGYPIHKKLDFSDLDIDNIYSWILQEYDLTDAQEILDAGCGVGFGSLLFAQKLDAQITGLSISPSEVKHAKKNAKRLNLEDRVAFHEARFENAPIKQYDFIIAIESLKHSFDLKKSLESLKSKLKPGGRIIIIEDFHAEDEKISLTKQFVRDWALADAYRLSDYRMVLKNAEITDLTARMPKKKRFNLLLQHLMLNGLHFLKRNQEYNVYQIFRGGVILDRLYLLKKMKYGCLVFTK